MFYPKIKFEFHLIMDPLQLRPSRGDGNARVDTVPANAMHQTPRLDPISKSDQVTVL